MKKKRILMLLLAIIALAGSADSLYARRGGRGGGRGGYYRGRGWGRGGYYRGRGWGWGPSFGIGVDLTPRERVVVVEKSEYLDKLGSSFWEIRNKTPYPIKVEAASGGDRERLSPGETEQLDRGNSFNFIIKMRGPYRQTKSVDTRDHYISIEMAPDGNIIMKSWS